jgi:hypothetical protein
MQKPAYSSCEVPSIFSELNQNLISGNVSNIEFHENPFRGSYTREHIRRETDTVKLTNTFQHIFFLRMRQKRISFSDLTMTTE